MKLPEACQFTTPSSEREKPPCTFISIGLKNTTKPFSPSSDKNISVHPKKTVTMELNFQMACISCD